MRLVRVLAIFCVVLAANLGANPANKCGSEKDFTYEQKEIIAYAYNYGRKYNLGYTLAAIAWHESCAGEYRMNFADPSAGLYHALIPGVIRRYQMLSDTGFNRNVIGQLLVKDDEFASKVAIDELLYWDSVRNGNWKDIIKSYNKGFSWEKNKHFNQLAEAYYRSVKEKKEILEDYIPRHLASFKIKKRPKMLSSFGKTSLKNRDQTAKGAQIEGEMDEKTLEVIEQIRHIEVATLKNDDAATIKKAQKNKKAVISVYSKNDEQITHEKTITLQPFYTIK